MRLALGHDCAAPPPSHTDPRKKYPTPTPPPPFSQQPPAKRACADRKNWASSGWPSLVYPDVGYLSPPCALATPHLDSAHHMRGHRHGLSTQRMSRTGRVSAG